MKGERAEKEIRRFLAEFLPERYGYSSGIVIDNSGSECDRSRQQDILVIDSLFSPKLFLDEEPAIYPVEVVYCGIEIKTSLDARELKGAVKNIASLKSLKFAREDSGFMKGIELHFTQTTAPIGMIFAFDTPTRTAETLLKHFATALEGIPHTAWPDLVCILNRGIMSIGEDQQPVFHLYGLLAEDDTGQIGELLFNHAESEYTTQGQQYPVAGMNGKYYVVDVARTFITFLNHLCGGLQAKVIIPNFNLLGHYIPPQMSRSVDIAHQSLPKHSLQAETDGDCL
jgi:hypothetical protein